jgi:cytochrome c peroxidase
MRRACVIWSIVAAGVAIAAARRPRPGDRVMEEVKAGMTAFAASADTLDMVIGRVRVMDTAAVLAARRALVRCRLCYKGIRFFLEYFFRSSALIYDQPAKYEAEEPFVEWEAPRGLQYIESLLYWPVTDSTVRVL